MIPSRSQENFGRISGEVQENLRRAGNLPHRLKVAGAGCIYAKIRLTDAKK
jgi:hypothetical protein